MPRLTDRQLEELKPDELAVVDSLGGEERPEPGSTPIAHGINLLASRLSEIRFSAESDLEWLRFHIRETKRERERVDKLEKILNGLIEDAKDIKPMLGFWGKFLDPMPPGAIEIAMLINKLSEINVEEK